MEELSESNLKPEYLPISALVAKIEGPSGNGCKQILNDHYELFAQAPGSSGNHQAWPGGYLDHVTEIMNIGLVLYQTMNQIRPLPFSESDVLLITFLHDLEKPFKYTYDESGALVKNPELIDKAASEQFKLQLLTKYGIELSSVQKNALEL